MPTPHACDGALRTTTPSAPVTVRVWHAGGSAHVCEDRWQIAAGTASTRIVICDGVTSWRADPDLAPTAGAHAAALAAAVLSTGPLDTAAALANRRLHEPTLTPSRRQAMTAAAALDCRTEAGQLTADGLVAADCEVWAVDSDGRMELVAGGDFLTAAARQRWEQTKAALGDVGFDRRLQAEAALLEDPTTQQRHALGRYAQPELEPVSVTADALVVASDGACLQRGRPSLDELDGWLRQVVAREARDDLTCMLIAPRVR